MQTTDVEELVDKLHVLVLKLAKIVVEAMEMVDQAKEQHAELTTTLGFSDIELGEDLGWLAQFMSASFCKGDPYVLPFSPAGTHAG
jgi:hypothetical protein